MTTLERINQKRDELMKQFSERTKVADQGLAFYDKRFGFEQGFSAAVELLMPEIQMLQAENAELKNKIEFIQTDTIHTCHNKCQRYACVMRREIESLTRKNEILMKSLRFYSSRENLELHDLGYEEGDNSFGTTARQAIKDTKLCD